MVETYLLNASMDLYGKSMRVAFVRWLREERKYSSLEALAAQIGDDCQAARHVLADLGL